MNMSKSSLILMLARETVVELKEELKDLDSRLIKAIEYSDMPMGSGGKKCSQQEQLLERRVTIKDKINTYKKLFRGRHVNAIG